MENHRTRGFTLLELLIVIAIVGILTATLIPNLFSARQKANLSSGQSFTRNVVTVIETLREQNGKFDDAVIGTDCSDMSKGFPSRPAVVNPTNACTITFDPSKNEYLLNVKLDEASSGTGNAYYTYDSRSMQLKTQSTSISF
jgi:prepilin-type N-terminal cleavage/methylation domain-containing protein